MKWYQRVPKDVGKNLLFRQHLIQSGLRNYRNAQAIVDACADDILFYINVFGWIYEPRSVGEKWIPFITYPFQDEIILEMIDCIKRAESLVCHKSRDMGLSWCFSTTFEHQARFVRDSKYMMLSRTEKEVDSADSDSLFWKIQKYQEMLPEFFENRPRKVGPHLTFPDSRSIIAGATNTEDAGVGGRCTAVMLDEFSRYDATKADAIMGGIWDVSNTVMFNFTVNPILGKNHPSYRLVELGRSGGIRYRSIHWSQHPDKAKGLYKVHKRTKEITVLDKTYKFPPDYEYQTDGVFELHSVWFDKERRRRNDDRHIQGHLELDFDAGGYNVFDHDFIYSYIEKYCRAPLFQGDVLYDPNSAVVEKFVAMPNGPIHLWINPLCIPRTQYVAGVDVSLGISRTNSVMSIARADTGEKVFEFAVPYMKPEDFAVKCVAICKWLSSPRMQTYLCWELQGPGMVFGEGVEKTGYTNVYYNPSVQTQFGKKVLTAGYSTKDKSTLLANYNQALGAVSNTQAEYAFLNRSKAALEECLQWVHTPKGPMHKGSLSTRSARTIVDPSGAPVNHGDRVIADAICCKMVEKKKIPVQKTPQHDITMGEEETGLLYGGRDYGIRYRQTGTGY